MINVLYNRTEIGLYPYVKIRPAETFPANWQTLDYSTLYVQQTEQSQYKSIDIVFYP